MIYKIKTKRKMHSVKWDRCVKKVSRKRTAINPFAVCTKRLGKKSFAK